MVAAAVIGGVATLGGAAVSASAAGKASDTAEQTAQQNNALQAQIYGQNAATLNPFETRGNQAGDAINSFLNIGGTSSASPTISAGGAVSGGGSSGSSAALDNYLNSTGYQFQFNQGQKAVTAALGAKGELDSGAALKSLTNYGQQAALTGANSYLSALQTQQQTGLSAAAAQACVGQSYANSVSANNNAAATTSGNADLAQAKVISGALGSLVTGYGYSKGLSSSYGSSLPAGQSAYGISGSDGIY